MPRQRLRTRSWTLSRLAARLLAIALALALIYGGAVVMLLALGVSARDVNEFSGYRTAYDSVAGITAGDITDRVRLIAGLAGLTALVVFGLLAWGALPRPYLDRSDRRIAEDDRGYVNVSARALERAVEGAALEGRAVTGARARCGEDRITVDITARGAADVPATLAAVRDRAHESLRRHELPAQPIDCTLTALDRQNRRELA